MHTLSRPHCTSNRLLYACIVPWGAEKVLDLKLGMGRYHIFADTPICRYWPLPIPPIPIPLDRAASAHFFACRYRYCLYWKRCRYADISDTDTSIGPSLLEVHPWSNLAPQPHFPMFEVQGRSLDLNEAHFGCAKKCCTSTTLTRWVVLFKENASWPD